MAVRVLVGQLGSSVGRFAGAVGGEREAATLPKLLSLARRRTTLWAMVDDISGERCTHYTLLRKEVSPCGGRGLRPCWRGFAPMAEYLGGGLRAPARPFGWLVDNPAGCPPANPRLPRLRRSDLGRFHGLTDSFSPIACRLSRLVSSSGVPPQSAEGTAGGGGRSPWGPGAAGPAVQGAPSPWGTDMSYPQLTGGRYPFTGERYPVTETAHS